MTDSHCPPGLANAAATRAAEALAAAQRAITSLDARGLPVTFRGVAAASGVSISYLYKNEAVAERVRELRPVRQASAPHRLGPSSAGAATKLKAALDRNRVLEADNARLRRENLGLLSKLLKNPEK